MQGLFGDISGYVGSWRDIEGHMRVFGLLLGIEGFRDVGFKAQGLEFRVGDFGVSVQVPKIHVPGVWVTEILVQMLDTV